MDEWIKIWCIDTMGYYLTVNYSIHLFFGGDKISLCSSRCPRSG